MNTQGLALLGAYLVGSIPTAYILVQRLKHVDVRTIGSGNVGATNASRAGGLWLGATVFLLDALKGLIAARLLAFWFVERASPAFQLSCGLAAVIGHTFPVFLKFRGGKGVSTTIGVILGVTPAIAGIFGLIWLICFLPWRYASVSSIAATLAIPVSQLVMHRSLTETWVGLALVLLIIVNHRQNIVRLVQGREHRAGRSDG
jgi:glycerol-3-phosphate acyltransferase PlsY